MPRPVGSKTRKPNPRKVRPDKYTLTQREMLKVEVQRLDLQGYSEYQIAQQIEERGLAEVSRSTVHNLLAEINADYQAAYVDDRKRWVMKATAAHLDVIREAQEQIARLKANGHKKTVTKTGTAGEGGYSEEAETVEDGEVGGFLKIVQDGWREIALLHGLRELPAQVFNVQVNANTVNVFDQLLAALLAEPAGPPAVENGPVIDVTPTVEEQP